MEDEEEKKRSVSCEVMRIRKEREPERSEGRQ